MMTRKDFERAAIRILCEMIVADGYVVKEELGELAKWAHEYKLWMPDYKPKGKCNKPSRKDDFNPIIGRFNTNKIQEAYGITLAKAITDVNEWNTTHKEDVDNLLKQLEQLSVVDSECTPNEARIRQALFYVLKKGAVALSVKKDYKFSKREIIYIENNIEDDYIVGELEELHWMNPDSEIWQGFEIFRDDSKESVDTEECFHNYLRDLYHGVNEDIQNNFYHYQRELKLMGFDFVYIPHTIAKMDGFGMGGELLLPAIQIVNPQKLYGKSFDEVLKVMRETRTHDFTHTLLNERQDQIPNVTPSLLMKISDSNVITSKNTGDEMRTERYTDFLIIKIENGIVRNTIEEFLATHLSMTKNYHNIVEEHRVIHFNALSFDRTLLDYAANRVYGKECVKRIVFDFVKSTAFFEFGEGKTVLPLQLSARGLAFYLLIMYKAIPQPLMNDMDFDTMKDLSHKYPELYRIHKECSKIYESIYSARKKEICLFKKGVLQGAKNDVITAFNELPYFPNKDNYMPKLFRRDEKFDIERGKIDISVVFVRGDYRKLIPLNVWWKDKIKDIML